MAPRRYLIVGAGAVGQPLCAHLVLGGASVAFLVKEKYAAELKGNALTLEWLSMLPWGKSLRTTFTQFDVYTSALELKDQAFDAVILTVASTALRQGEWLKELADIVLKPSPTTALVFTTSAMSDLALLESLEIPQNQLVQGGISFISWQAPLPDEKFEAVRSAGKSKMLATVGYVLPSFLLSGPAEHTKPLAEVMNRGKMPCSILKDVEAEQAFAEAMLMPLLVGLENCDWSFSTMRNSGLLGTTTGAMRECLQVAQAEAGPNKLWKFLSFFVVRSWNLYLLSLAAPWVMPFDIQAYLKYHFCKVGDQTKQYIDDFRRAGEHSEGLNAMPNLAALVGKNWRWKMAKAA